MKLSKQEAQDVIYEHSKEWEPVNPETITEKRRWYYRVTRVFKHAPSGKLYRFNWNQDATEMQDEPPFEYDNPYEPVEVVAVEKLVTVYEQVA